jgi:hypothetical protein
VDEEAIGMDLRKSLPELLKDPVGRGMGRHVDVQEAARGQLHDDEDVHRARKAFKVGMVKKSAARTVPAWRRRKSAQPGPPVPGRGLRLGKYLRTERGETASPSFSWSSSAIRFSRRVLAAHAANQLDDLGGQRRATGSRSRGTPPEESMEVPVPPHQRLFTM